MVLATHSVNTLFVCPPCCRLHGKDWIVSCSLIHTLLASGSCLSQLGRGTHKRALSSVIAMDGTLGDKIRA